MFHFASKPNEKEVQAKELQKSEYRRTQLDNVPSTYSADHCNNTSSRATGSIKPANMSNIKNLRAMFEQNNKEASVSPPEKGCSPGDAILFSPGTSTTPPRPLSKVRTNFVTVERTAQQAGQAIQLGLKRQDSSSESNPAGASSMAKRRPSFSLDEQSNPQATAERKESISQEFEARKANTMVDEPIPESALAETPALEVNKQIGDPEPIKGPIPERGRELAKPAEIKENPKKSEEASKVSDASSSAVGAGKSPTSRAVTATKDLVKASDKATKTKPATRPAPISTAKSSTNPKPSPRTTSPTKSLKSVPKTPTTPTASSPKDGKLQKIKTPEKKASLPAKTPEKKPGKKTSSTSLAASSGARASSKPRSASRPAVKTRVPPSPPQGGASKTKAKSPTRPVQLPASLLAPTASSGSKGSTSTPPVRQTQSRASGAIKSESAPRSQSRASTAPKASHPPVSRSATQLKIGTTRPSLGPPSTSQKKNAAGNPPASAPLADDGFLSRMMRPTASSASKSSDKSPPPPKRSLSIKRPSSSLGHSKVNDTKAASHAIQKVTRPTTTKAAVTKSSAPAAKTGAKAATKKATPESQKHVAKPEETKVVKAPKAEVISTESVVPSAGDATNEDTKEIEVESVQEEAVEEAKATVAPAVETEEKIETPVAQTEVLVEEPKKEVEVSEPAVVDATPESPVKEEAAEPAEEVVEEAAKEVVEEPEAEKEETTEVVPSTEEAQKVIAPISPVIAAMPEDDEDPEDAAARAEIARINAEMMAALNSN
ncbi:hypothetical protein sscle_04g035290 [Sclerotinia sclerotiorum 1980 UF-70]|uniref:Mucin-7 n=1 Tax=Sclerotinia sclerotiorum (strain ATCC 18683 / 1980 / Ss-1) TaxID=665079 RepID=A0A1D9Q1J5_SCLS1|nr:hypothetical protein sscle_04g035290 [Sclerotinia sclerotiorum 1980 UF-70]